MANYTTADVKRLRELTAAGMMDCKRALDEADGDFTAAVDILRVKGAKDVGKRSGRTAANGLIAGSGTAMLELNCETDFVAKNETFQALAADLVDHIAQAKPSDVPTLLEQELSDGQPVQAAVDEQAAKLGEKFVVNRFAVFEGTTATYLHKRNPDLPPQVGVLVEYTGGDESVARAVAMHIAAMSPRYVSRADVPADVVSNERRIAEETAREEGKPEAAMGRIVEGRVNGFFKDATLLEQASVREEHKKQTMQQVLSGAGVTVTRFARFEVGRA
ncbi:MAG: translation elongation factor Ts [Geodermatophilaceae bacterium]|jgi:elongation factor Ts|nr:elongation factor Ts [Geodermatophilaceae bacterium]